MNGLLNNGQATRAALSTLNLLRSPVWVFDLEKMRMWWANAAAVRLWDAPDLETLLARDFNDASQATRARLHGYLERFGREETVVEQWTFYPNGQPTSVQCVCSEIRLAEENGRIALLIEATYLSGTTVDADLLRSVEVLRHTPLMVSLWTLEGHLLLQNPAAIACYGELKPLLCDRFADRALPEVARRQTETRGGFCVETVMQTQRGLCWHRVELKQTTDPITGLNVLLLNEMDISDRKATEAALTRERNNLARAQQVAHVGSWELNLETLEIVWSQESFRIFGLPCGPAPSYRTYREQIYPEDLPIWDSRLQQLLRGQVTDVEFRIVRPSGEIRYLLGRGEPIFNGAGQVEKLFGTILDITEQKQAEFALAKAKEAVEAASRAKSAFFASVSHELRTPLNAILGFSELLVERAPQDLEQQQQLEMIHSSGTHLLKLILMLDLIEAGNSDVRSR